jgi:hypothetical protein
MFKAVMQEAPDRALFITFNIREGKKVTTAQMQAIEGGSGGSGGIGDAPGGSVVETRSYTLEQKMEILRRWCIFGIKYRRYLPTMNCWWAFCEDRKPYSIERIHTLFKSPLVIEHAPAGLRTDWEFETDPMPREQKIVELMSKLVDVNKVVFNNTFSLDPASRNLKVYYGYSVDDAPGALACTDCKNGACNDCKNLLTAWLQRAKKRVA